MKIILELETTNKKDLELLKDFLFNDAGIEKKTVTDIINLGLPSKIENALRDSEIHSIDELEHIIKLKGIRSLRHIRNIGEHSLQVIEKCLSEYKIIKANQ